MKKLVAGQMLLVVCCVFYIIWWALSYKPDTVVNRMGGIRGVFLLITAVSGIAGTVLSIMPVGDLPVKRAPWFSGIRVFLVWGIVYIVLLALTKLLFHRPVTTELLLITGWWMLELNLLAALKASGMTESRFMMDVMILSTAFVISMILYVLYYRMNPEKAYYWAMVPLVTEALGTLSVALSIA